MPAPTRRVEPGERFDKATGVVWAVPSYSELGVLAMHDEPGVFVEGHPMSMSPDWHAISSATARSLALALLAAADWSDRKHPPLEST